MYIQLLECSTYTTFPWCLHYLELSWNLDQPESHQSSRNNMKLVCTYRTDLRYTYVQ